MIDKELSPSFLTLVSTRDDDGIIGETTVPYNLIRMVPYGTIFTSPRSDGENNIVHTWQTATVYNAYQDDSIQVRVRTHWYNEYGRECMSTKFIYVKPKA